MCRNTQLAALFTRIFVSVFFLASLSFCSTLASAEHVVLQGEIVDPQGSLLPNATITISSPGGAVQKAISGADGKFRAVVPWEGPATLKVAASGFQPVTRNVNLHAGEVLHIQIGLEQLTSKIDTVTVTADVGEMNVLGADPAQRVFVTQDLLDANPGRPGAPVSIPGYPIETASSGIKAPQYFAPGVAGDHGEPIAQYIAVGTYLVPNNLSANAHGNGYSDPNIFVPEILESVQIDGGAYNVREGNHSLNLAAIYGLRSHVDPFVTVTGDVRDLDVVTGFAPDSASWLALSGSFGNGFLKRLEHRQQYKLNGERVFSFGRHQLTLLGIGYYGYSYIPGLVPIQPPNADDANFPNIGDTIDPRQKDQTHTGLFAASDAWQLDSRQQLQLSGFFRTYNLSLFSNFGQGLIRQSEGRTVSGGNASYVNRLANRFSLLMGFDFQREAPRNDALDHYGFFDPAQPAFYGPATRVAAANVTIKSLAPYIAGEGKLSRFLSYYLGWRADEVSLSNVDLVQAQNSFQKWVTVNSPKATVSINPGELAFAPAVSLSAGKAFFTNDPRIGSGAEQGTLLSTARSYQLVARKTIHKTDLRLTLGHVTTSATLAKIDPDTGLQQNEGPGRMRYVSVGMRQNFSRGSLLVTYSQADARDLSTGQPTPEAPRMIFDLLGAIYKLPLQLKARGEFEYVGAKPLGTGCVPVDTCNGVPVKEFRTALSRSFWNERLDAGLNLTIARGFTGQTTENFFPSEVQEIVGVRIPSYASVTFSYRFGRSNH
ncbi:MAG TPA: TonB-dependent receptor [Candidatus Angelobacter sp.]|nr:TonB-dependent receptor [Candidatus Angelobacter sp.]